MSTLAKKLFVEKGIIDQPIKLKKNVRIGANIKLKVLELDANKNITNI